MAHKALLSGTAYEVIGGKDLIDATAYTKTKGRTLVDGTGYDIEFCIRLGDVPVGESVFANLDGVVVEFVVKNHGIPEDTVWRNGNSTDGYSNDVYDDSVNGTWLLMKNIYCLLDWQQASDYVSSGIPAILEEFLGKLDIRNDVMTVNLPASEGKKVQAKAFLLSLPECGLIGMAMDDGTCLDYFHDDGNYVTGGTAFYVNNDKRIAYFDGEPCSWLTRSIPFGNEGVAGAVGMDGYPGVYHRSGQSGIRPALIMPFETRVSKASRRIRSSSMTVNNETI